VWYSLVVFAVLAIFAVTIVWQEGRIGLRRVDRELDDLSATLVNVLVDELGEMPTPAAAATEVNRTMAVANRALAILDERGSVLAASWNGLHLRGGIAGPDIESRTWTADTEQGAWRVTVRPASFRGRTYGLLVASPLADAYRERREAQEALWIGIPIALVLAAAGGLWLASIGLRPLADMARRASRLAPNSMEDFGESDRRDEIGQLARAFNGLVARLRQALGTQRRFMADASHELRTPVSAVQSTADVMLARESRPEAEYREALQIVGNEARRIGRLVDDMLVLARADAGGYPLRRVSLYLNEVVLDCGRTLEVLARERGVRVCAAAPTDVAFEGDEDLLRRMVLNLVRNAVQHSRGGGTVSIDVAPNGRHVAIRVKDEGRGIPAEDRARIFDRFVQLDAARRGEGSGLGLAIARWVAEAHGGTLDLEDSSERGSTFRVSLPLDAEVRSSNFPSSF
jgi:heavy metal sensor kinase